MRKLPLIMIVLLAFVFMSAKLLSPITLSAPTNDSPHGEDLKVGCEVCHSSAKGWKFDKEIYSFNHSTTAFSLEGQHHLLDCKMCHPTLKFKDAPTACVDCHTDMHQQTVGPDCSRCHTPNSWIVNNISDIHRKSRFPLVGAHYTADCSRCHTSASLLQFNPLGVECYDCHQQDFTAATAPNHVASGYSHECTECHNMNSFTWSGNINHNFFPLSGGHAIDCMKCHTSGVFQKIPKECNSCHQDDYNAASNPSHTSLAFPTNCEMCHTIQGWQPADFTTHDPYFPIYSGKHNKGVWNSCSDCHKNSSDFKQFTCTDCHEHNKTDMDEEHGEVGGYSYNSEACLACHPRGDGEGNFDHNSSSFPLTGAHITTACNDCHTSGYQNTSSVCSDCHIAAYNGSTNPNHVTAGIPNTCATCHTTNPGWQPATFPTHNNYYMLAGAHVTLGCAACHGGNYSNQLPQDCFGCHTDDYTQTTSPNHQAAQFPTECLQCHSQNAWTPANWDHDGQYFPIYSGKHKNEWSQCSDCHTNPANYSIFTCTTSCHPQSEMNNEHNGISGYAYESNACLSCHPDGNEGKMIRINNSINKD